MKFREIAIPVRLDEATFRRYCHFDTMLLHRRWFKPVLIGMIAVTLGMAALLSGKPDLETLAGILVGVGIAIPLMFFGLYFLQVKAQVAERKLKDRPGVYTIHLREDGVSIVNDQHAEDPIDLPWPSLAAAYRVPGCIYLYVNSEHAFLLPDGQANVSQDAVWECLNNNLGVNRCFSRPAGPRARTPGSKAQTH